MKKILFAALAALALVSCHETEPTCSPTEATIYVGDTLQLTVTGETNPQWSVMYSLDSTGMMGDGRERLILEVIDGNRVVGIDTGTTEVFFFWYPEYHINGCAGKQIGCTVTVLPAEEPKDGE